MPYCLVHNCLAALCGGPHEPRLQANSDAEIDRERGHEEVISLLRRAASHPHKGPNDTDASMLRAAAKRLRGGYEPGGSNTKQTVARVCELVASLIDETAPERAS